MTAKTGSSLTLRKYARLDRDRRTLKEKLAKVEAEIDETEPGVIEHFQRMGMDRATIDGTTIYLRRELWAGKADGVTDEAACDALAANGLGDYVKRKFNTQSVSAFVRELDGRGEPLPAPLAAVLKISEVFKIGTRRS